MSYNFTIAPEMRAGEFDYNLTYNLGAMLRRAGFNPALFDILGVDELALMTKNALFLMRENRVYFKRFEPDSGYGDVMTAILFLETLDAYLTEGIPTDYKRAVS